MSGPKLAMTRLSAAAIVAALLSGCGEKVTPLAATQMLPGTTDISPSVFQTGQVPVQWTQFHSHPKTSGELGTIVVGPDKNMWFVATLDPGLIKMGMVGERTEYALPFDASGLVVGADKNFYVFASTAQSAQVAVVTTTGTVTPYTIPSGDSSYFDGAALGSDGNVWFVEQAHIGMITPAGTITEYPYPDGSTGNQYKGMVSGPDGNLWFTEYDNNTGAYNIGMVVPSTGAITFYPITNPFCELSGLAPGAGKFLWFSCDYVLGKITTEGIITYVPQVWPDNGEPSDIVKGPDGNPWWLARNSADQGTIAEYHPATGSFTAYQPPYSTDVHTALALGPDGNIWTTTSDGHIDVYIIKVLGVTPTSLTFTGPAQMQTITASETDKPKLTASSSKPSVATVAAGRTAGTFTVTSVSAGTCAITVRDGIGNSVAVAVTVE
jgi:streptogramin lyase